MKIKNSQQRRARNPMASTQAPATQKRSGAGSDRNRQAKAQERFKGLIKNCTKLTIQMLRGGLDINELPMTVACLREMQMKPNGIQKRSEAEVTEIVYLALAYIFYAELASKRCDIVRIARIAEFVAEVRGPRTPLLNQLADGLANVANAWNAGQIVA
ncbi:hypothetical protein HDE76_000020 [Rhodanobacter sp. ANJX3]|uniref:hypothetical protein n=1 Tax=Rhodanobacter sp. ANJX3 TaxID=2723083 RepID=UPI001620F0C0|nr:hypothetical protein [Rhodanobacter sp. ANJX3]MBB5356838.1 hypothetical protein [Rhodanobacter sp. ANJX3]